MSKREVDVRISANDFAAAYLQTVNLDDYNEDESKRIKRAAQIYVQAASVMQDHINQNHPTSRE